MRRVSLMVLGLFVCTGIFAAPGQLKLYSNLYDQCAKAKPAKKSYTQEENRQACAVTELSKTLKSRLSFACPKKGLVNCYIEFVDEIATFKPLTPRLQLVLLENGIKLLSGYMEGLKGKGEQKKIEAEGVLLLIQMLIANGEAFVRNPSCKNKLTGLCNERRVGIETIVKKANDLFPPTTDKKRDELIRKTKNFGLTKLKFKRLMSLNFYEKGLVYFDGKNYKRSIAEFSKSLKADPDFFSGYYSRASARFELKDYRRAAADYTRAAKIDSKSPRVHFMKGLSLRRIGKTKSAKLSFARAKKLSPSLFKELSQQYKRELASN